MSDGFYVYVTGHISWGDVGKKNIISPNGVCPQKGQPDDSEITEEEVAERLRKFNNSVNIPDDAVTWSLREAVATLRDNEKNELILVPNDLCSEIEERYTSDSFISKLFSNISAVKILSLIEARKLNADQISAILEKAIKIGSEKKSVKMLVRAFIISSHYQLTSKMADVQNYFKKAPEDSYCHDPFEKNIFGEDVYKRVCGLADLYKEIYSEFITAKLEIPSFLFLFEQSSIWGPRAIAVSAYIEQAEKNKEAQLLTSGAIVAKGIQSPETKLSFLSQIADKMVEYGSKEEAVSLLENLNINIADSIAYTAPKAYAVFGLGISMQNAGLNKRARQLIVWGIRLAQKINDLQEKAEALSSFAESLKKAGFPQEAKTLYRQAEKLHTILSGSYIEIFAEFYPQLKKDNGVDFDQDGKISKNERFDAKKEELFGGFYQRNRKYISKAAKEALVRSAATSRLASGREAEREEERIKNQALWDAGGGMGGYIDDERKRIMQEGIGFAMQSKNFHALIQETIREQLKYERVLEIIGPEGIPTLNALYKKTRDKRILFLIEVAKGTFKKK